MAENTEIASSPRKQENKSIVLLLPKFQLNLPFFFNQQPKKAEETVVSKGTGKTSTVSEADDGNASSVKPSLARFPDATRPILPPPIELEAEEPTGRTSNPVVLWQCFLMPHENTHLCNHLSAYTLPLNNQSTGCIEVNIILLLVHLLQHAELEIKEAAWAISKCHICRIS
ncbi:hypothetical protein WN944_022632 [Citrus x changshan-huyou]|uniref:Uncharacterized protein n=1 Tax=Citrus x changshan-huyou TaxID=2935761 RepID=A0AAP0MYX7_9ROSI